MTNGVKQFIIYKLQRRSATLSTLAFDTNKKESTIKKYISELKKDGYNIKEQAGWFSLLTKHSSSQNQTR